MKLNGKKKKYLKWKQLNKHTGKIIIIIFFINIYIFFFLKNISTSNFINYYLLPYFLSNTGII